MRFLNDNQFNNSRKDASCTAPCFSAADEKMNSANFTDIAIAVSFLLCFALDGIIAIIGIIFLIAIIILGYNNVEQKRFCLR